VVAGDTGILGVGVIGILRPLQRIGVGLRLGRAAEEGAPADQTGQGEGEDERSDGHPVLLEDLLRGTALPRRRAARSYTGRGGNAAKSLTRLDALGSPGKDRAMSSGPQDIAGNLAAVRRRIAE